MEEDRDGLWRQAVEWLTAFGVLPADHRCCSPDSKLIDLLYTLRDGVLLCHLLNKIDPTSLDFRDVSLKPQMAQVGDKTGCGTVDKSPKAGEVVDTGLRQG